MKFRVGRGFRYIISSIGRELWRGLNAIGIHVPVNWMIAHPFHRRIATQIIEGNTSKRLLVPIDFTAFPLSFDIVFLLMNAEASRRHQGYEKMDVAFLGHEGSPLISDNDDIPREINSENYRTFVCNIGIESTQLLHSTGDVYFFTNRAIFTRFWEQTEGLYSIFPTTYSPLHPKYSTGSGQPPYFGMIHLFDDSSLSPEERFCLTPPKQKVKMAKKCLTRISNDKTVVTITLRNNKIQPSRNSLVLEWQNFVDIQAEKYPGIIFVILPDFHALYDPPQLSGTNVLELPEAVLNVTFRAAIYQEAHLNLFTGTGPASLCYFNHHTNYISFGFDPGEKGIGKEEMLFQHGCKVGESFPFSSPYQKLVWERESCQILCKEFENMMSLLLEKPKNKTN